MSAALALVTSSEQPPAVRPERPVLRWFGGKFLQADDIIALFPPHRRYVEPYGGAASVLLRKSRSYIEIYNDLDQRLVELFMMLRDDAKAAKLIRLLELTPFAREEFLASYEPCDDEIEAVRRWLVRSWMGHGADGATGPYRTGFRASSTRSGSTAVAREWAGYPEALRVIVARLRGVVIESRPALELMKAHDAEDTLFFVDPPYLFETRKRTGRRPGGGCYAHELSDEDHRTLLALLKDLRGAVILCGYPSPMYDLALRGWLRLERKANADGASPRTEVLWLNGAAADAGGRLL